jgi:hypothetical protein
MKKNNFWDIHKILKLYPDAHYYVVFGERSNGKTYGALEDCLKEYFESSEKNQFAYLRRWDTEIKKKSMSELFSSIESNGVIFKLSKGKYNTIVFKTGKFYLATRENDDLKVSDFSCGFAFALNNMEHDKSVSYPNITRVIFDEFISRMGYLADEFVTFTNVLSTIIRQRNNVKIFMLGNTVNKYCPYFGEMGLKHIKEMKPGTIDLYTYGEADLRVAVEYCTPTGANGGKASDVYFSFDNPKLNMITSGIWEINIYPHCPCKYRPSDVIFTFFMSFDDSILQGEIISRDDNLFLFFHRKSTPLKDPDNDVIVSSVADPRPNHIKCLTRKIGKISQKIMWFFQNDKVFFQDNEVGEMVRNYIIWSDSQSIKN